MKALSLRKPPPPTLSTLITCITKPLKSLGVWAPSTYPLQWNSSLSRAKLQSKHPTISANPNLKLHSYIKKEASSQTD